MFYSKSTGGFYISSIHGSGIPKDAVEISDEQHANLLQGQSEGKIIDADQDGSPILIDRMDIIVVPSIVTMRQARLALLADGKLDDVEAAINSLPEPQRSAARIEWDYSSEVHRSREFVQTLGAAIGLGDEELDDLFMRASAL